MSKTDKTRPAKVQMLDHLAEFHDHSDGVCNLPTPEEWLHMTRNDRRTWMRHNCFYEVKNWHTDVTFSRTGPEQYWRKRQRREMDKAKYGKDRDYDY